MKAEIGRTLALIVPELEMAKALQKKLVAENEALEKVQSMWIQPVLRLR